MADFSELIKNIEKSRTYLRDFFVYGFKTHEEFSQKSKRTYEDEKRRTELLLGDYVVNNRLAGAPQRKVVAIPVDAGAILKNPFYGIYYVKSFSDIDIKLHFAILDLLSDGEKHSLKDLTDTICGDLAGRLWKNKDSVGESTVRAKLTEYTDEGLVEVTRQGNRFLFSVCPDTVEDFFERYKGLADAVRFFSEIQEFGIVGNMMLRAAGLENDLFYMKHSYIIHTLEDEILMSVAEAIGRKCPMTFENYSTNSGGDDKAPVTRTVIPFMVLMSVQTGRRHLLCYEQSSARFTAARLDQMRRVKIAKKPAENFDELAEKAQKALNYVFGVSFGKPGTGRAEPVTIKIFADEKEESYIIDRIMREKRCGIVERTAENEYTLTFDIFDPGELLGWLKTFTGRIISFTGGTEEARERLFSDIRRMQEMYGGDGNGAV